MRTRRRRAASPEAVARLTACRKRMRACGVNALLVANFRDYHYLTGFTGEDSAAIVTPRDVHILTDARFLEEIKSEVPWAKVRLRKGFLQDEFALACADLKLKTLAFQPGYLTVGEHAELKKKARGVRLLAAPPIVGDLRKFKDAAEVAMMRKAIRVAEDAFVAMRKSLRVGQTETQIAAKLEYEMRTRGAERPSFPTICAEGANAAAPHARPGSRKLKRGSALLVDWGAQVNHYCSDLTRMLFVGTISPRFAEIYRVVLEAQMAGVEAVRPGARLCDVDEASRAIIKKAGFGKQFTHGLGHGLGLDVHEPPSVSWRSKDELEPGMLVTIEPGIYLPGVGGVRIEDDVLVTANGRKVLTTLGKSLDGAIV